MKVIELVSICGHAQHGKSTLAGRLMYEFGAVSDSEIAKLAQECKGDSDYNAFSKLFMRSRTDYFNRGGQPDERLTIFPQKGRANHLRNAETKTMEDRAITIIDAPNPEHDISNFVYGIYLSDVSVLVIECVKGVQWGTEAAARVCFALGIPIIAVLVTKMDADDYSQTLFEVIKTQVHDLWRTIPGMPSQPLPPIIPISALHGVGLRGFHGNLPWYEGESALDVLESSRASHRLDPESGVRFAVEGGAEIFSPPGVGTVIVGMLEQGTIHQGEELIIEPASTTTGKLLTAEVRSLQHPRTVTEKKGQDANAISARALVALNTPKISVPQANLMFRHGGVLGTQRDPPAVAREIQAEIIFFEPQTLYMGRDYVLHTNASYCVANISSIENSSEKKNLTQIKHAALAQEVIRARLTFQWPICIESSAHSQRLAKFILREQNRVIACGRCLTITR